MSKFFVWVLNKLLLISNLFETFKTLVVLGDKEWGAQRTFVREHRNDEIDTVIQRVLEVGSTFLWEFDPGSGRTLAACLTHASRARRFPSGMILAADGWVTRG